MFMYCTSPYMMNGIMGTLLSHSQFLTKLFYPSDASFGSRRIFLLDMPLFIKCTPVIYNSITGDCEGLAIAEQIRGSTNWLSKLALSYQCSSRTVVQVQSCNAIPVMCSLAWRMCTRMCVHGRLCRATGGMGSSRSRADTRVGSMAHGHMAALGFWGMNYGGKTYLTETVCAQIPINIQNFG